MPANTILPKLPEGEHRTKNNKQQLGKTKKREPEIFSSVTII